MEEASGKEGLLGKIRPPRLEEAGLENCALPPEAIREAFFKAANSIRSGASTVLGTTATDDLGEDDCVKYPGPTDGESSDTLIGIFPTAKPPGPCGTEKGARLPEVVGDDVVAGAPESSDKVLDTDIPEEGKPCVDGLQGLKIGDRGKGKDRKSETQEEEEDDEQPILVEAYL